MKKGNRIIAIYDVARFNDLLKKATLNPSASCVEGLNTLPETLPFVVPNNLNDVGRN
jgi:hypothetical protein